MINTPDYDRAATAAMKLLIEHNICETPVNPLPILLSYPGVRVVPYTRMADEAGINRSDLVPIFGNQDAATFHLQMPGLDDVRYVVVYNMQTIPGAHVDPDLNRRVRDLFAPHIKEYIDFHLSAKKKDRSPLVDLGTFMEGYDE